MASQEDLFKENPQLRERETSNLADLDKIPKLFDKDLRMTDDFSPCEHHAGGPELPPDTRVYFVIVEGEGSYIVDNFVARHELPDFDRWPDTFACLVAVVSDYASIDERLRQVC